MPQVDEITVKDSGGVERLVPTLAPLIAKDFATQTTLAAVLEKISADPATQTTLAAVLSALGTPMQQSGGSVGLAAIAGMAAITPSDAVPVTAGVEFAIVCSSPGDVKVKFSDGTTLTFPVAAGFTVLRWAVIQVFVTGTTATATYSNLV